MSCALDLALVLRAVIEIAPSRWYSIGQALGYSEGELVSVASGLTEDAEKMRKIVNVKAMGADKVLAYQLLQACRTIKQPVFDEVQCKLQELHSNQQ